jgi:signal transduction histidine kinase
MIELGEIKLKNRDDVVEARNKIHTLARDLGFDSITAARLASVSSEIMRKMSYPGEDSHAGIMIALDRMKETDRLVLKLKYVSIQLGSPGGLAVPAALFDDVTIPGPGESAAYIEVLKMLPLPGPRLTRDFIAGERELVGRQTRAELYRELQVSYKKLQDQSQQIVQTEKLRTLGTMAAGIAHELNNPMMGILNYLQYCQKHTAADDRRRPVLADAEKEIRRCIYIVENLLTFSHTETVERKRQEKADLTLIIDGILSLLSYRISAEGVAITKKYAGNIPCVPVEVNKMKQVFLNLVKNALDALEPANRKEIRIEMQVKGNFLEVTVADTGCGIKPGDIAKIFDPFFTTKEAGMGTGLGLSVVGNIIREHGGKITCESEPGQGTVFKVFLPLSPGQEENL